MRDLYTLLILAILSASGQLYAQHCHLTLQGTIREDEAHAHLSFATVSIRELGKSVMADEYGHYAFDDLCEDSVYTIFVSHVECDHQVQIVRMNENSTVDFILTHKSGHLQEMVVVEKAIEPKTSQASASLNPEQIETTQGMGLGDLSRQLPGVSILSTGATISKPVIQGLSGNRIAVVANGVPIEGQQWGQEHAPEFDPFVAGQVKVIKGAAAIRYGPGAMGGALLFDPPALPDTPGLGGWISGGGFSNGRAFFGSGALQGKWSRIPLSFRLQATGKNAGNFKAPGYYLGNTGNQEFHQSLHALWKRHNQDITLFFYQYRQQLGILQASHTGNLADLIQAIEAPEPLNNQDRFTREISRPFQSIRHQLLQLKSEWRLSERWKMQTQYAFQYNVRKEFDAHKPFGNYVENDLPQISFFNYTNTLDNSFEHKPFHHWQGTAGVQGSWQYNQTGTGGYVPDHLTTGISAYAWERWRRFPHPLEFEAGIRYDFRYSHITDTTGSLRMLDTTVHFGQFSGMLGVVWHFRPAISLIVHTGMAWRPPYATELFARGVHHGAAAYENGNSSLIPEQAWNSNISLEWKRPLLQATATVFYHRIAHFIYLQPDNTFVQTVRGAFPSYSYRQDPALLTGWDLQLHWQFFPKCALQAKYAAIRGRKNPGVPAKPVEWLPLMSADHWNAGIRWESKPMRASGADAPTRKPILLRWYFQPDLSRMGRQTRIPSEGLLKEAPDAYWLMALDGGLEFDWTGREIHLGVAIRNLTNVAYRDYLNFFRYYADEPGYNAGLRIKIIF